MARFSANTRRWADRSKAIVAIGTQQASCSRKLNTSMGFHMARCGNGLRGGCYVYQRLARMVFSTAHTRVGGMMGNQRNRASSKTEHVSLDTVGIVRTVPSGNSSKLLTFGAHLFR